MQLRIHQPDATVLLLAHKTVEPTPRKRSHLRVPFQQVSREKADKSSLSSEVLCEKGLLTIKGARIISN